MILVRWALATSAAAALALSPIAAQAAPAREASSAEASEGFVGNWVIVALLVAALVPFALLFTRDSDNEPVSP